MTSVRSCDSGGVFLFTQRGDMTSQEQKEYRGLIRGAAAFILRGKQDPPIDAAAVARVYKLDLETVIADVDAIVQSERRKTGGVFETKAES